MAHAFRTRGDEARTETGQIRAFRKRMKDRDPFRVGALCRRDIDQARGRVSAVDLGIAFVGEDAEIVLFGEIEKGREVFAARHGPLRVRGRADEDDGRAVEHVRGKRCEIREEPGFGGRRDEHGIGHGGDRTHGVDLVERVRDQHERALAGLFFGAEGEDGVEKALARAVQPHDPVRGDGCTETAGDPAGYRLEHLGRAVIRGVFSKLGDGLGQHVRHPIRKRVPGFPDGHRVDVAARGCLPQKRTQTRERVFR